MVKYIKPKPEAFSITNEHGTFTGTRTLKGVTKVFVEMEFKGEYLTDDKHIPINNDALICARSRMLLLRLVKNNSID